MAARLTFKVPDEVRDILTRSTITATSVKLPDGQLDRKLYDAVNKVLAAAGGKWDRKSGTHKFTSDPREAMGLAVDKGEAVNKRTLLQAFYTPPALADRLVAALDLRPSAIGPGILEPSIGAAALALAAVRALGEQVRITGYEIDDSTRIKAGLALQGRCWSAVQTADFLTIEPTPSFDAVLMNPPFSGGQDIAHVTHAIRFLRPGGRLAAIMWPGWQTARTKAAVAFRALLETMDEYDTEDISAGTFDDTNVRTVLLTLRAPS